MLRLVPLALLLALGAWSESSKAEPPAAAGGVPSASFPPVPDEREIATSLDESSHTALERGASSGRKIRASLSEADFETDTTTTTTPPPAAARGTTRHIRTSLEVAPGEIAFGQTFARRIRTSLDGSTGDGVLRLRG